ncbi:hypothetical protein GCM10023116_29750 [Kistimonas scapharcae]|uniref:AAA+ ATPase domain-containing protein n=1 Tax=Kistimonas scapharcae TaxID=1036133 RepID=A0ABP8V4G6_9GAMM
MAFIDLYKTAKNPPEKLESYLPALIRQGSYTATFSGGSGKGKSSLIGQLALELCGYPESLSTGLRLNKDDAKITYLPAEDPEIVLQHRFHYLLNRLNDDQLKRVLSNFSVDNLMEERPNICEKKWIDRLHGVAQKNDIIICDTARRFHDKKEEDNTEMNYVLNCMTDVIKNTNCILMVVGHITKEAGKNKDVINDQYSSRGGSVIVDNSKWNTVLTSCTPKLLDYYFGVKNISEKEAEDYIVIGGSKTNFGKFNNVLLKRINSRNPDIHGCHFERIRVPFMINIENKNEKKGRVYGRQKSK